MADSMDFDATGAPRALEDALSLVVGTRYTLGNAGETVAVVRMAATQPAETARGHPIPPYGGVTVTPQTGAKLWVWSRDPDGASLIVTEAA